MEAPTPFESGNLTRRRSYASSPGPRRRVYWRVEGSLLNLTAVRPVAFFAWNAQSFLERWVRRGLMAMLAAARPFLYLANRVFATRLLHAVLRGVSQDRLDLLGEEYFEYVLKPRLKAKGVAKLKEAIDWGEDIVLVSQALDHIMRPLAEHLGVGGILCNRLEFRNGLATGRLHDPVIRPRGLFARLARHNPDGRVASERLLDNLGLPARANVLAEGVRPARRVVERTRVPVSYFRPRKNLSPLSVRETLQDKQVLLIGATGFIGKVWLANLLSDLPEIGKVFLLIRSHRGATAAARFRRLVEESPVFDPFFERDAQTFVKLLEAKVEVIEGDATKPGLGLRPETQTRLAREVDLIVNSSGLTDFNPDLRDALATNVRAVLHLLAFQRRCDHAALLHLSTCYVIGAHDGRVFEEMRANHTPAGTPGFRAAEEVERLESFIRETEARAESPEVTKELCRQALAKRGAAKDLHGVALENQIRKNRVRWLRQTLTEAGTRRANQLGWPNTYTFTKSLAESLVVQHRAGLPVAVVRPAIVESSLKKPFRGWNEGINTSASLSYLLSTFFRQLPTNERKCLDVIPVDLVSHGMMLIAAALVRRQHEPVYHLATSVTNPCDMRRSIELTALAHRKHYRAQDGFAHWLRSRFDAIPVSKQRYEAFSAPAQKALIQAISRTIEPLPLLRSSLARRERELDRMIKTIALFEPFILHNDHVFEAGNIERLADALAPEERDAFGYDARSIDWWDYWINVHIPALRRWCYPLIEGRPPEVRARRSVSLAAETPRTASAGWPAPATTS